MNFPDKDFIIENIKKKGYFISKGLLSKEEYQIIRKEAINYFHNKQVSKNKFPKALRGGIKAGMEDILGYTSNEKWKILRGCFFNWNRNPNELSEILKISREISSFRNELIGLKSDYGSFIEDSNYIQYSSLSLYPSNGGFLQKHSDGHAKKNKLNLLHFKIELTHKNADYSEGGFYFWDREGNEICISSLINPGDVLFFDGSLNHEIKPIKGEIGRIGLFEIPTYVEEKSRFRNYSDIGEPKNFFEKIKYKVKYNFFLKNK